MDNKKSVILLSLGSARLLPEFKKELEAAGQGREVLVSTSLAEIEPCLGRIEIGMGDLPFGLLPRMTNLKWLQLWSAGADFLQKFPEAKKLAFKLTTSTGIHGQQIAEHLFAMLLGWNRRLGEAFAAQKRRSWLFVSDSKLSMCQGKTMLILGYGAIGETIAGIAQGFGIRVIGLRRNPAKGSPAAGLRIEAAARLGELLPEADYVVNILPSTPATRHSFGAAEFRAMQKSALYINIGRGATTDEGAMIEALRGGHIAGALLDVVDEEPLGETSPLWDMDNVIITGHYAGCRPGYSRLAMDVALDNLARYDRGEELKNLVDKQQGY
jgi:phosphoglycerate dehydrogenase-like enzyme